MGKRIITILMLLYCTTIEIASAQNNVSALLPMPSTVEQREGKSFDLRKAGRIECMMDDSMFIMEELSSIIKHRTGIELPAEGKNRIIIREDRDASPESYTIDIDRKNITLKCFMTTTKAKPQLPKEQ